MESRTTSAWGKACACAEERARPISQPVAVEAAARREGRAHQRKQQDPRDKQRSSLHLGSLLQ